MKFSAPCFTVLLLLSTAPTVWADEPVADYIFPAGGRRGTKVEVHVGGTYFHTTAPWEMLGEGVSVTPKLTETETLWFEGPPLYHPTSSRKEDYPRDHAATVTLKEDAPLGAKVWRVWTSQGATENRVFVVGDLPEVVEQEAETGLAPMDVVLPVTINGRIFPREEIDVWRFNAQADQVITCSVAAQTLGSPLIARLEAYDAEGKLLAETINSAGTDPTLHFRTPTDGQYQVRIYDVNYEGMQKYVYRLTLTSGPFIEAIYPLGGRRGEKTRFELTGQNLPKEHVYEIPANASEHHTAQWTLGGQSTNPIQFRVSDLPESLEQEPNDSLNDVPSISLPTILNGRIGKSGDVDLWSFSATKGQTISLDLLASRLGSPLDSVLQVLNSEGTLVKQSDDFAAGQTDSRFAFTVPTDGTYFLKVSDRFAARGGANFAYRIRAEIIDSAPDFQLTVLEDVVTLFRDLPLGPDEKPMERGKKLRRLKPPTLKVNVQRINKFAGEIEIIVDGLPQGVTVTGTKVAKNATSVTLNFTAADETKIAPSKLKIRGTAILDDKTLEREAEYPSHSGMSLDHVLLAVALDAPFRIESRFMMSFGATGSLHEKSYDLNRYGYEGPLEIRLADRQFRHLQGVTGPTITVPAGERSFDYAVKLDPWMVLGRTSRTVLMGIATVTDHDGSEHVVSFCSTHQNEQVIAVVKPGELTLTLPEPHLQMPPGESKTVSARIQRGSKLANQPVELELVLPLGVTGITAKPIKLTGKENQAELILAFDSKAVPPSVPVLIRATTTDGEKPFVAEAKLELLPVLAQ